ncbi:hypothetical protein CROQUDRAFT_718061 [Cronartium quercuum f. sp. fusiforme G11]|uniref:Uncharacterized protein n=1 Tax=Cronartium quercuum f. sp. fusiforme G11 TaxID=708437 RepID=A0A9P6NCU2_9BASI|nr:hypothetical protein CROQUDRAFT_718061 [Cronartium quercuum f. sp. fusiforme G11]
MSAVNVTSFSNAYINLIKLLDSISNIKNTNDLPELKLTKEIQYKVVNSILNFPEPVINILDDKLPERNYRLIDLFGQNGNLILVYTLLSRGVSVRYSKSSSYSSELRMLIKEVRKCERSKIPFHIPNDIQLELDSFRVDCGKSDDPITSSQETSLSKRSRELTIGDYKPSTSNSSNIRASKRARAAELRAHAKAHEVSCDLDLKPKSIKPELNPLPTLPDHGPPYVMKVSRIPRDANRLSIQTFFEVGADAYKLANKLEHRIDALWRKVEKYRPSSKGNYNHHHHNPIMNKFDLLNKPNDLMITEEMIDGWTYKTAYIHYHTAQKALEAIKEFHQKRFLVKDLMSKTLICTFE